MAWVITEACVGEKNGKCVEVCPVDCIHGTAEDPQRFIDPDVCLDCGACQTVCPVQAIFNVDEVPELSRASIAANAQYFAK